jgi:hypothetical protein
VPFLLSVHHQGSDSTLRGREDATEKKISSLERYIRDGIMTGNQVVAMYAAFCDMARGMALGKRYFGGSYKKILDVAKESYRSFYLLFCLSGCGV